MSEKNSITSVDYVYLRDYSKVVFFYPLFIISLILWIVELVIQGEVRWLGLFWLIIFFMNLFVIAFDVSWQRTEQELHRALNAVLPKDIAIGHLTTTYSTFHPRFEAEWRRYRYTILNQPIRSPLWARNAHHVAQSLDVAAMADASQALVGSRDFAAFGKPTQGQNTVRHVMQAEWFVEHPRDIEGRLLIFEITANAFLNRMVRNIVGTLLRVGRGEFSAGEVAAILVAKDRAASGPPAPSCGLCLVKVEYSDNG